MNFTRTRSRILLTAALAFGVAAAQTTPTVTASAAVTAALTNNPDVKTAQANLDKAQAANRAAQADPSALVAAKLGASGGESQAQAALRGARMNTMQNTVTAFTALLEAQENVELQTLQVSVDSKNVQVTQVKQGIGNATALDVNNAQNTLSGSQQNLADARAQVSLASARLSTLTGLGSGVGAAGAVSAPKLSTTLSKLQAGLNTLTAQVSANNDLAAAQLNVKLADNDFTPARTLEDARTALANAQRSVDSASKSSTQTLASAYQTAQNSYELLSVAGARETAASKTYMQDASRLKSGTISPVELQLSQLALKKAQFARLQAQDNVLEALVALSVASGQNLTGIGGTW